MSADSIDNTLNVDDVTRNDLYMTPHEAQVFDRYQQNNGMYGGGDGTLNQNDYYPGFEGGGHGTYSGSIVGSIPLFGGGGALVPMGMYDARDMAIRKAAVAKAKEVEDFRKSQKAPTSKLVNINDHLTNEYIDYQQKSWDKALSVAGGDPHKATYMLKNDPEYKKKTQSFENMAKLGDDIVNKTAQDEIDERSGNFTPTPRYKELRGRLYKAFDPSHPEFKNLATVYRTMQMERDFSHAVDQVTKKAFADEHGLTGVNLDDPDFVKVYNGSEKQYSPEQIEGFAQVLNDSFYNGSDYWTPEKVKTDLANMLRGKVKESKVSVQQKRDDDSDGGVTVDDISNPDESQYINSAVMGSKNPTTGEQGEPRDSRYQTVDAVTFKHPVKTVIPVGQKFFNPKTGDWDKTKGVVNATIGGIRNIPTLNNPKDPLHEMPLDEVNQQTAGSGAKYKTMVDVTYTEKVPNEEGKETVVTHSALVPVESIENAINGKKGQNKAVIDEIKKRAGQRNSATPATEKQETKKESGSGTFYTIKGKQYSEESVNKKAKASGMTVDEYLSEVQKIK